METQTSPEVSMPPSEFRITFGKKYKGLKLRDISKADLLEYSNWLSENAVRTGQPLADDVRAFQSVLNRYLSDNEN